MTMGASVGSVKREPDSEERDDSFEDSFLLACLLELFRSHMSAAVSRSFFYFLGPPLLFLTAADSWPCFPASPGRAWRLPSYTRKTSWASSPAAPYNPGNRWVYCQRTHESTGLLLGFVSIFICTPSSSLSHQNHTRKHRDPYWSTHHHHQGGGAWLVYLSKAERKLRVKVDEAHKHELNQSVGT